MKEQIQKYVRLPSKEIIIFSKSLEHFTFKHLNLVAADLCIIDLKKEGDLFWREHYTSTAIR